MVFESDRVWLRCVATYGYDTLSRRTLSVTNSVRIQNNVYFTFGSNTSFSSTMYPSTNRRFSSLHYVSNMYVRTFLLLHYQQHHQKLSKNKNECQVHFP